jgi:hypothetical protein
MAVDDPIERARKLARETAHEMEPTATETDQVTEGMHELDGIVVDEKGCDVVNVLIMYDEETDRFALVDETRSDLEEKAALARKAELETKRAALLQEIELKVMMAFFTCEDEDDAAATWAAIDSTTAQSARLRIAEIGGDIDAVKQSIDRFFLEHPESQ